MYKIVRNYYNDCYNSRTVKSGLTLEEAQEHCRDPETSSRTCQEYINRKRTTQRGHWFDSYTQT